MPSETPLLQVRDLAASYGPIRAIEDISLEINAGELVAIVGANGAGKTTLLRTLSGVHPRAQGEVIFQGQSLNKVAAHKVVAAGISQVPEGRQVFAPLSVEDNLRLGGFSQRRRGDEAGALERIYSLFPILKEKRAQAAGTLSGGQQQMLAIGRALLARPQLLLLDEPSMGLAPLLVEEIFRVVQELNQQGVTILLVEQNARAALGIADRGYVLETGRVVLADEAQALLNNEEVQKAYLGH